jgi:transformation/transcription domain-associated protein
VSCSKYFADDRSIGGGRFEALYKEVLPILQEMLDKLAYLLDHATTNAQRDLFVELTLTVPVRLTNLLPHLGYLMKPLVHALQAGPDQVSQGLRTLELCIDNLTADFLDPTMGIIVRDLMSALNRLLKPIPANRAHAQAAMKILGKLGGRNRRFQEVEIKLDTNSSILTAPATLEGKSHRYRMTPLVETALAGLDGEEALSKLQVLIMATLDLKEKVSVETDRADARSKQTTVPFKEHLAVSSWPVVCLY